MEEVMTLLSWRYSDQSILGANPRIQDSPTASSCTLAWPQRRRADRQAQPGDCVISDALHKAAEGPDHWINLLFNLSSSLKTE
jgi:hypothetical protein